MGNLEVAQGPQGSVNFFELSCARFSILAESLPTASEHALNERVTSEGHSIDEVADTTPKCLAFRELGSLFWL